jgi:hypothetical protein
MKPSASRSRVTVSCNPLLPEFRADPYQTFHRLRAGAPVRLALVTVLQSTEGLSEPSMPLPAGGGSRDYRAVVRLRRVWAEQYVEESGQLSWRTVKDMPAAAELIASPTMLRPATVPNARSSGSAIRCASPNDGGIPGAVCSPCRHRGHARGVRRCGLRQSR